VNDDRITYTQLGQLIDGRGLNHEIRRKAEPGKRGITLERIRQYGDAAGR
jgi:hypothetical protein